MTLLEPAVLDVSIRKDYVEIGDGAGAQTSVLTLKKNDYGLWQMVWPHGTSGANVLRAALASGEDPGRWGMVFRQPGDDRIIASGPITTIIDSEGRRNGIAGDAISCWGVTDLTHLRERTIFPVPTVDIPVYTGLSGAEFRRNHFPVPSAAVSTGWATVGATLTREPDDMGESGDGGFRFRLVTVGTSTGERSATTASPADWATAAGGQRWALSCLIRTDSSDTFFQIAVDYLAADGTTRLARFFGSPKSGGGTGREALITPPAPAGTAYARAAFFIRGTETAGPADPDRAIEFDQVLLEQTDVGGLGYFDGDTEDRGLVTYEWTGTPGASKSIARRGPAHAWSAFTRDKTGPAETVALEYIRENIGDLALARRRLSCELVIPVSLGRGPVVTRQPQVNRNVLEETQELFALAGLIVDLVQTAPNQLTLMVREPAARDGIVWSASPNGGGTAAGISIKSSRRPKTEVINSGSGDDPSTAYVRVMAAAPPGGFSEVREEFIKGSGDDAAELVGEAEEELVEDAAEYGLDVEPMVDAPWRFGVDYELGDLSWANLNDTDFLVPINTVLLRHEEGTLTEEPSAAFDDDFSLEPLVRMLLRKIRRLGG